MQRYLPTYRFVTAIAACSLSSLVAVVPAAAEPPLDAYGRLPQVEYLRLSPSGERVAMIGVADDKRQLLVVQLAGNKLLKGVAIGDNKVRDVAWAGEDHILATVTATSPTLSDVVGRYELAAVVHIGLDGRAPWSVFDKADGIEHVVYDSYGSFLQEGHWSAYFAGLTLKRQLGFGEHGYLRENGNADLYRVDLDTAKATLVLKGAGRDHAWVAGPDGSIVAHEEYESAAGEWALYAGALRDKALLKRTAPLGNIELTGLGRSPGTVLVIDQSGEDDLALEIDLSTGHTETLFDDCTTTGYLFDPVSKLLIGATTVEEPGARLFDAAIQRHYNSTRKAFPMQKVTLTSFTPNLVDRVVFTTGSGDSGTYWSVNGATHHADAIGYAYPTITPNDVGPIKMVSYRAADGLAMEGVLTLPPGRDPTLLPLVVLPHGGPIGIRDDLRFDWWAQAFASRGYAVFQPNYRGSGGYSAEFRHAGYGQWGRKILTDIADGVSELGKQRIIDPKRVCIMGASYGGYAALAGVTLQNGLYRCAVSVAGVANMATFLGYEESRSGMNGPTMRYWRKVTGAESTDAALLYDLSPAKYASRADAPILLIHGKDDSRVPIDQSLKMAAALKSANKPYEYVELDKEDHFLSRDATRVAMLQAAMSFVEKYNPSGP